MIFLFFSGLFLAACGSETNDVEPYGDSLKISIGFNFDRAHIGDGTIISETEAGYPISISRLQFYLSDWIVERKDGTKIYSDVVALIDASIESSLQFSLDLKTSSDWETLHFLIVLPHHLNHTNALKNILENQNMAWPEPMGGGYHFLKLEGRFSDIQEEFGYAMHIGMDTYVIPIQLHLAGMDELIERSGEIKLHMNIDEWFKNPHTYDFNREGNYSMGDFSAMHKLSQNGQSLFSLNN